MIKSTAIKLNEGQQTGDGGTSRGRGHFAGGHQREAFQREGTESVQIGQEFMHPRIFGIRLTVPEEVQRLVLGGALQLLRARGLRPQKVSA